MRAFLAVLIFLSAATAHAQDVGERYDYNVQWGYADVAKVTLKRGCPRDGYVPASLLAKSMGVAEQLHSFEIRLDSFTSGGHPLEGRTFIEEEGVPRLYRTRFADSGAAFTQKTYKNKDSSLRLELRPPTHDLLSWFFALRQLELSKGAKHSFYVWDGWKLTRVTALVGKTERVWTPRGTYMARVVSVRRTRLHHKRDLAYQPKAAEERLATLWFSEDENRTPVAIDFRAPVGLAKLRLSRQSSTTCP